MGKLHELLAVEADLKGTAEKIIAETITTFTKKSGHFKGQDRKYQPLDEEGEKLSPEDQLLVTTVFEKLQYSRRAIEKYFDALAQKEITNVSATSEVRLDGVQFLPSVPATLLLALEGKLKQLRVMLENIPTNDPQDAWKIDPQNGCYVTDPIITYRSKKVMKTHVAFPATDHHPAQVQTYSEDVPAGKWITRKFSGMVTPLEKSQVLERLDVLAREIKQARQRANCQEVFYMEIGEKIFDYILAPLKKCVTTNKVDSDSSF